MNEGERARFCYWCDCPLPQSLLKYGMESELEHYESDYFKPETADANEW